MKTASKIDRIEIRRELDRILSSESFRSSERHRRFISFVVEEKLAGRADRIKAYSIALSALGRGDDFDPQQDSIVRIEAGRLRRTLERYYLTEGVADPVRIEMPKGTYVPDFKLAGECHAEIEDKKPLHAAHIRAPRIFVSAFEQVGGDGVLGDFSGDFTRQVIMGLTRFGTVFVYGPDTSRELTNRTDIDERPGSLDVDFVLSGTVDASDASLTVEVLLQELPSGRYVWADRFERNLLPVELRRLRDDVAGRVAQKLAQPYGIIFSRVLDTDGEPPKHLHSYRAVLNFYRYLQSLDPALLDGVRLDLEAAIEKDPSFAEAYACLSQIHVNSVRFAKLAEAKAGATLKYALDLARTAIMLAPDSSSAHHALGFALWFSGQPEEGLNAYRRALQLNPNDSDIMADFSVRLALSAQWDEAVPLLEEAYRRNPCQPPMFRMTFALDHLMAGRYEDALRETRAMNAPHLLYANILLAATTAELGRMDEARETAREIERQYPGYGRRMEADLCARNVHPDIIFAVARGLKRAGLPGLPTRAVLTA